MELHGYAYAFFGGPELKLLKEHVLDDWEQLAYETFAYDGMGGKGQGESAVYRKITAKLTEADRQLLKSFGKPKDGWTAPLGWLDDGRPWLTWTKDGRILIDAKAAAELRRERLAYGDGADHPHAIAASAVMLVLQAIDNGKLHRT